MPPITVTDVESDGEGGWLVAWRDEASLDGRPCDGFTHLTDVDVDVDRRQEGDLPGAVARWLGDLEGRVADAVGRHADRAGRAGKDAKLEAFAKKAAGPDQRSRNSR